jgi:NTE family protein
MIAFALQGGGSLSAAEVGMLRALTEHGIVPDLVVGASAGALNAVAYAANPTAEGIDQLDAIWRSLRRRYVAPLSARALVAGVVGHSGGLVSSAPLRRIIQARLSVAALTDTAIPAYVVATELESGEPVVLSRGDAVSALLASSAFPGLYPPVTIGGRQLIDGGVSADVPVLQAEALGATVTYVLPSAVDEAPTLQESASPLFLAYRALGQILDGIARRDTAAARGRVLTLPTVPSRAASPVDFRDTSRMIAAGYDATAQWLARQTSAIAA